MAFSVYQELVTRVDRGSGDRVIGRSEDPFTAETAEFAEETGICLLGVLGDLCG